MQELQRLLQSQDMWVGFVVGVLIMLFVMWFMTESMDPKMMAMAQLAPTEVFTDPTQKTADELIRYHQMTDPITTELFVDPISGKVTKLTSTALYQDAPTELFVDPISGKVTKLTGTALYQDAPTELFVGESELVKSALSQVGPTELFVDPASGKSMSLTGMALYQDAPTGDYATERATDYREDKREVPSLINKLWS